MEPYRGVEHSVKAMMDNVLSDRGSWSPVVRFWCEKICKRVAPKDYLSEILAIRYWALAHAPYMNDPAHVEWVRDPQALLEKIQEDGLVRADCDEINSLTGALWLACGRRVQIVTVGFEPPPAPHTHVFVRCEIPGMRDKWVVVDPVAGSRENTMLTKVRSYKTYELDVPLCRTMDFLSRSAFRASTSRGSSRPRTPRLRTRRSTRWASPQHTPIP